MPRAYIQNPGEELVHLGEESQNPVVYMVSRDACEIPHWRCLVGGRIGLFNLDLCNMKVKIRK